MALSNSQYNAVMRGYEERQRLQRRAMEARTQEIYQKIPQIQELDRQISTRAADCARRVLGGDTKAREHLKEDLADYFRERLEAIYDSPDALAQSLAGYDYSEDGTAPYGYSYLVDGKVWICMEVPHALGDYIEIELDTQ